MNPDFISNILLKDSIRRPLSIVLNRFPALKQELVRWFLAITGPGPAASAGTTGFGIEGNDCQAGTHIKVLGEALEKNRSNPLHTPGVNRIFTALKTKAPEEADRLGPGETPGDIVVAAYLYTLRRYPSQKDIENGIYHIDRGATAAAIVQSLMSSIEYHTHGSCCLDTQ